MLANRFWYYLFCLSGLNQKFQIPISYFRIICSKLDIQELRFQYGIKFRLGRLKCSSVFGNFFLPYCSIFQFFFSTVLQCSETPNVPLICPCNKLCWLKSLRHKHKSCVTICVSIISCNRQKRVFEDRLHPIYVYNECTCLCCQKQGSMLLNNSPDFTMSCITCVTAALTEKERGFMCYQW